jgi:hypothetical protein
MCKHTKWQSFICVGLETDLGSLHALSSGDLSGRLRLLRGTKGLWPIDELSAVLVLAILGQAVAGLALRGIYADGAHWVTQVTALHRFVIFQPARWTINFLFELPIVTTIKLHGISTPQSAALIFSLTTNMLPGFIILSCRYALPAEERQFFVFPAFAYFGGILAAQFASVTEGLVATAYIWFLFYLILFGQLSIWRLGLIAALSIGSIRLHEEMLFLGPVLMAGVWLRWRDVITQSARIVFALAILMLLAGTVIGTYRVLFPQELIQRGSLIHDVLYLRWLYVPGTGCNSPAALAFVAGMAILTCMPNAHSSRSLRSCCIYRRHRSFLGEQIDGAFGTIRRRILLPFYRSF